MGLEHQRPPGNAHPPAARADAGQDQQGRSRHPEMASLACSAMVIIHPDADGTPTDKIEYLSYLHIASVETAAGEAA